MNEPQTGALASEALPANGLRGRITALMENKEFERFWKFAVVGTIGAVIDYGVYTGLLAVGWLENVTITLPFGQITDLGIAGSIAFTLAVISNFIWNRYWTYPDSRSKSLWSQLVTFFLVNIVGLLIRIPVLELLSKPLANIVHGILPAVAEDTTVWFGQSGAWAIAVVLVMFWNFFVNRYWTYNDVD